MTSAYQYTLHTDDVPPMKKAFLIAIVANAFFVVIQMFIARLADSTSLFADAIHNLGDVLSLVLAWTANYLMQKKPTSRSTYGFKKTSILASLANGTLLIFTCGVIVTEAMYKLHSPACINAPLVMMVAAIGIVVNGASALPFMRYQQDLNIRGAFLHLTYDALISFGVLISAGIELFTGWVWLDPVMGLLIASVILKGSWSLCTDSFRLIMDGVPSHISIPQVHELFMSFPGVVEVHDLHVWAISTRENALSVHLWMPEMSLSDDLRQAIDDALRQRFNIHHSTIQVERVKAPCAEHCGT